MAIRSWKQGLLVSAASVLLAACGGGESAGSGQSAQDTVGLSADVPNAMALAAASAGDAGNAAEVHVTALTKLSETRVSRTVYDYVFKLTVSNPTAQDMASVAVILESAGAGTTVLDQASHVGALAAGAAVVGDDTIVLRHDRSKPFDAAALRWTVQTRQAVTPAPVVSQVTEAVLKPGLVQADTVLVPTANPRVFVDATGGSWQKDQLLVRDGNVYKVTGSRAVAGGKTELFVEGRPFHEAFDKLAFNATFDALVYDEQGRPVLATEAMKTKQSMSQRSAEATAALTSEELRARLGLAACVTPGLATEFEAGGGTGYAFGIQRCSLADLLRLPAGAKRDALSTVWLNGTVSHGARTTYVYDGDKRDNYATQTREWDALLTVHANVADALRQAVQGVDGCEVDGDAVTCEVTLAESKRLTFPLAVVNGVKVTGDVQIKWTFALTLKGEAEASYGMRAALRTESGMKGGVTIDPTPHLPAITVYQPLSMTGWEGGVTGSIHESSSIGVEVGIGRVADLPVSVAQVGAAIGGYVRAEASSFGNGICLSSDKGVQVAVSVEFFPAPSIGFDGIPLFKPEFYFPVAPALSVPPDCDAAVPDGKLAFLYHLNGNGFYAEERKQSRAAEDVYRVSGQWLQKKVANGEPFEIDLLKLLDASRVTGDKLQITASVPVNPAGSGASSEVVHIADGSKIVHPMVLVHPGTTQPGDTLLVAITVAVVGQPDRTVNKRIRLVMEPTLQAQPTMRYVADRDGQEYYSVRPAYQGSTSLSTTGGWIVGSNGEVISSIELQEGRDADNQPYTYLPEVQRVDYEVQDSMSVEPVEMVLETAATAGKPSSYRFPIRRSRDAVLYQPVAVQPFLAGVGDTLTIEIVGDSLPNRLPSGSEKESLLAELETNFPACGSFVEERSEALIGKEMYSTEYRKFRCIAEAPSSNPVKFLNGLGEFTPQIGFDMSVPEIRATIDRPVQGQAVTLHLGGQYLGNWVGRTRRVVWSFGEGMAEQTGKLSDKVTQAFAAPGTHTVTATLYGGPSHRLYLGESKFDLVVGPAVALGQINSSPSSPTVLQQISLWISNAVESVRSVVWAFAEGVATRVAEVINGTSEAVTTTFATEGNHTVTATYMNGAGGTGTVLGATAVTLAVAPAAAPAAPSVTYAAIGTSGLAIVRGTAEPGVGVRVTWPDGTTAAALAASGTGAFEFTRDASGMRAGDSVQVVAYTTAGTSTQATAALASMATEPVVLREDFNGTAIDTTKWTQVGFSEWGGQPNGPVTVSGGLAEFGAYGRLSSRGKVHISSSKIVIEARMAGQGAGRDTVVYLMDTQDPEHNWIAVGDTNYENMGLHGSATGIFAGGLPYVSAHAGNSTALWMEYRLTIDGDQVTVERGPTLASIDERETRTFKLARSIAGRTFFLHPGTGGPSYSPGSFDWLEVRATLAPAALAQDTTISRSYGWNRPTGLSVCGANWTGTSKSLLQFDHAAIPASATEVFLNLYIVQGDNNYDAIVDVFRNATAWDAATVQWSTPPSTTGTPLSFPINARDYSRWVKVPITPSVKAWQAGSAPNHGFTLNSVVSPNSGCREFASSRAEANRPFVSWQ